jgi:hypothetical protein
VPPAPIDLEPRCADAIEALPPVGTIEPMATDAPDRAAWTLSRGVRLFVAPASRAGLERLDWGFPLPSGADGVVADAPLAAALLARGETSPDPVAFRRRVLEIGASLAARVEGEWLWLELRHPAPRRDDALRLVAEWLSPIPARPDAFERVRRGVALARLASESAAPTLAARAFRRVHPPPAGALDPDAIARVDPEATPERVQHLLQAVLRVDGSVMLHAGATHADDVRDALEGLVARLSARSADARAGPVAGAGMGPLSAARDGGATPEEEATPDDGTTPEEEATPDDGTTPEEEATPDDGTTPDDETTGAVVIVDRPDAPQVEVLVGWPTVAPSDSAFADLEAWASLLGGNVGGRLFRDLRERQGLAYIIDAEQSPEGRFVVSTRARHERVVALVRGIEAHLDALAAIPLERCEVEMLRTRIAGEEALVADDPAAWSARARVDVAVLGHPHEASRIPVLDVDAARERLESVAARHLRGTPTVVLVGDADWLRHDFEVADPERSIRVIDLAEPPPAR